LIEFFQNNFTQLNQLKTINQNGFLVFKKLFDSLNVKE
jgi:hypothetical protein